ncbi:glycosyltransferase family 4 protein [Altererythrobacter arenosus]|uniref:Glycosyltransferase family 4 protein n=1 Tax=Altererythrobacter arenosus TaxID=3032592 RepID=A0ABY8FUN1_9SPHN|nr:glycosyltransferase family 4 protein [Altererythrobacter sp. CAU 1644]WFL78713.1 glycosyltransferase family 4 protein [Altererythrobacter sp. CAU 1644]
MKSVLFIGPIPPPITGQALACEVFLKALDELHSVTLVNINKADLVSGGLSWSRIREILRLLREVRREARRADAVYFTITESILGNAKDILIFIACWRLLGKMVIHLHGGAGMIRLLNGPTGSLRLLNGFFLRRIASVVVLGKRLTKIYSGIVPEERLHVVENFAEDCFQISSGTLDRKFASDKPLSVLYLSNMIPEKGYLLLRDAALELERKLPGCTQVNFAGAFQSKAEEEKFLDSISSADNMKYHGVVNGDEKRTLLAEADILALPTFYPYEGQPICILEGYASGCAVLTTDHSGIFDVFEPGRNGWEVEKGSSESIIDALSECLARRDKVAKTGASNAQLARSRFTVDRYNRELVSLVCELLDHESNFAPEDSKKWP